MTGDTQWWSRTERSGPLSETDQTYYMKESFNSYRLIVQRAPLQFCRFMPGYPHGEEIEHRYNATHSIRYTNEYYKCCVLFIYMNIDSVTNKLYMECIRIWKVGTSDQIVESGN